MSSSAASSAVHPSKRVLYTSPEHSGTKPGSPKSAEEAGEISKDAGAPKTGGSSSFRNVSACNRCRLRKNRCDQRLPSCASCDKANVKCVGYDPITKREIPRR